jgi:hypothetical protein
VGLVNEVVSLSGTPILAGLLDAVEVEVDEEVEVYERVGGWSKE